MKLGGADLEERQCDAPLSAVTCKSFLSSLRVASIKGFTRSSYASPFTLLTRLQRFR